MPAPFDTQFRVSRKGLTQWVEDPAVDRGIHFALEDDEWEYWSFERLARFAQRVAWGLVENGVHENDVVSTVERSGPEFVGALFGTLLAGATPSVVAPPNAFNQAAVYAEHVTGLLRSAGPTTILTNAGLQAQISDLAKEAGVAPALTLEQVLAGGGEVDRPPVRKAAEFALCQFTAGSSGRARGVLVPWPALENNLYAIRTWLRMEESDLTASWLPIHHDMGLIGCLLTPIVNESSVRLMRPEQFVRSPLRYLRCFGGLGASLTAMPTFGLDYIARRVRPEALEGMDFSAWRAVIVGAERIDAKSFERFHALLAPFGLKSGAFLPAYGLAEATLAVTALSLQEPWRSVDVDPEALAVGRQAQSAAGPQAQSVMGCGRSLTGVSFEIVDDEGKALPEGSLGEIVVHGDSVASGYIGEGDSPSLTHFSNGVLRSGDAGFTLDGQLFVLGRLGDSMKLRGRTVFAEDLESALSELGIAGHRVVALLGDQAGVPTVVVLVEGAEPAWRRQALALLRRRTEGAKVIVLNASAGAIARTSSGKPKRRVLWREFLAGRLPGERVRVPEEEEESSSPVI